MIKVFHINSYFHTNALHQELLRALDGKGVQQVVFLPILNRGEKWKERKLEVGNGSVVLEVKVFSKWMRFIWPVKMFEVWRAAKPRISEFTPNVVHAHTLVTNGIIAFLAKKKFGLPYVITVRNTDIDIFFKYFPPLRWAGKKVLEEASAIVLLSPIYRSEKLPKYFPVEENAVIYDKVTVVPNAVAESWHQRTGKAVAGSEKHIIFVGRLDKNKNLTLVIDALRLLSKKGMSVGLKVVGDGPELASLKREADGLDVKFYGRVESQNQIAELMRASDMLVVPSKLETFGLVYVEAMTQGLPVLYTAGQGFDGFFAEGEVGYSVDSSRPESVASAIETVYKNYERLSRNALLRSDDFRWGRVSDKLLNVYRGVAKQSIGKDL